MSFIRKATPGGAPGSHVWERSGQIIEIDDPELCTTLLRIPDADFSEVAPADMPSAGPVRRRRQITEA